MLCSFINLFIFQWLSFLYILLEYDGTGLSALLQQYLSQVQLSSLSPSYLSVLQHDDQLEYNQYNTNSIDTEGV